MHIVKGGERLYVYPFSYNFDKQNRKVFYLYETEEFPYMNDHMIRLEDSPFPWRMGIWTRIYYVVVKRMFVGFFRWISMVSKYAENQKSISPYFDFRLLETMVVNSVPFVASSYPEIQLHINSQLMIMDEEYLTNQIYIVPSNKWVEQHLDQDNQLPYRQEDYFKFLEWKKEELDKNNRIGYILSIDT